MRTLVLPAPRAASGGATVAVDSAISAANNNMIAAAGNSIALVTAGTGAHSSTLGGATRQCEGKTDTEVSTAVGSGTTDPISELGGLGQRELWEWVVDAEDTSAGTSGTGASSAGGGVSAGSAGAGSAAGLTEVLGCFLVLQWTTIPFNKIITPL